MSKAKYFDRGDHWLEIVELSPTERVKRKIPKSEAGLAAAIAIAGPPLIKTRRVASRKRGQLKQEPCPHLGTSLAKQALVLCPTCRGTVRLKLDVFACGLFGECVPAARHVNESGVKGCQHCPREVPS